MPVEINTGAYGCEVMKKAYCCEKALNSPRINL